ncbi:transposase [Candidatus Sumerlaeota bacterium]
MRAARLIGQQRFTFHSDANLRPWAEFSAAGARQLCLAHLLREIEETSKKNTSDEWAAFAKKLKRIVKRLVKHRYSLITFLDNPAVPADNNRAEREIRPPVIARKNSFQNASQNGARSQAIPMSIYRTLKLRDHDPLESIADALTIFIARGTLPELPRPPT